jgi:hypothetical protein
MIPAGARLPGDRKNFNSSKADADDATLIDRVELAIA